MADGVSSPRRPHCRLMSLSRRGKAIRIAGGSLSYLQLIATRSIGRGRKWIELNTAPASLLTLKKARRPRSRGAQAPCKCATKEPPEGTGPHFQDYAAGPDNSDPLSRIEATPQDSSNSSAGTPIATTVAMEAMMPDVLARLRRLLDAPDDADLQRRGHHVTCPGHPQRRHLTLKPLLVRWMVHRHLRVDPSESAVQEKVVMLAHARRRA